jgi:ADP-ribose 1''-phosphate phosphatase
VQYPAAFEVYKSHCKEKSKLQGTCLLISPQIQDYESSLPEEDDPGVRRKRRRVVAKPSTKKHWICCLFTSYSYGKPTKFKAGKDSPEKILSNTRVALKDLRDQVEVLDAARLDSAQEGLAQRRSDTDETSGREADGDRTAHEGPDEAETGLDATLGPLYACKFNSGSFGVEWKDSKALIEEAFDGSSRAMHVVSPPSQRK